MILTHLLENLCHCLICVHENFQASSTALTPTTSGTDFSEVMGSNPAKDTSKFSSAHLRQSLRLPSECEDHFLNPLIMVVNHFHSFYFITLTVSKKVI